MTHRKGREDNSSSAEVVNWNPPKKLELVERALSDGKTDPDEIVTWAKNYEVSMTIEEVQSLAAEIRKREADGDHASEEGSRS